MPCGQSSLEAHGRQEERSDADNLEGNPMIKEELPHEVVIATQLGGPHLITHEVWQL